VISNRIQRYLEDHEISYRVHRHPRAITAQETAQAEGVTGWKVVKNVACEVDGRPVICAIAAPDVVDLDALADVFGAGDVRLLEESELADLFPDCELGAAPPLGGLFGLPVIFDRQLLGAESLLMNAGNHEELLEVSTRDYLEQEAPRLANIGVLPEEHWRHAIPADDFSRPSA
jgi:Ala-tRNA(Pro) deacylase